mgnify:CR=1 FL=1
MIYDQDCSTQTARNRLAAFNFRGEDVFKPVSALSGGEQSRLRLCMLMDEKINLLILDEPTNHWTWPAGSGLRRRWRATRQSALCLPRPLLHQPLCHPYLDAGERTDH